MAVASVLGTFNLRWRAIAQSTVQALAIVKYFDVIEDRLTDLSPVVKLAPVNQLQFERAPKGFHRRVIVTIGLTAHRGNHRRHRYRLSVLHAGVLRSPLRIENQARRR